ncbi:hypothetical protein BS333_17030 [Vibrio azureus]|uniref:Uncharacterized protein n=1 Tax=Vibrio azureus NBRC 104587 TaxID=1219077 RepID=U3AWS3_9VIBR|nr:hypothetical protein [Vibrio azureus]AUI88076.1 hypothetical protein BS333_17030 [Vibrio azureus]GAD77672.1 hypothetical protein VAZ01S_085_00180 [Vibrio azureus NBRC 104587]
MESKYYEVKALQNGLATSLPSVLRNKDLIVWHSALPAKSPLGYDDQIAPLVMWAFASDKEDQEDELISLINSFQTKIGWHLDKVRNGRWRLMPNRVWAVYEKNKDSTLIDASAIVQREDPQFGVLANKEILEMARYLDESLR